MQDTAQLLERGLSDPERLLVAAAAGRAYANSQGHPFDHHKAAAHYQQAAERGDPSGMHNYGAALVNGQGVPCDPVKGREWIEKSANTGLATAQHTLSVLARRGVGGPRDLDAFVRWAQRAADQGLAAALYDLGTYFLEPDDARPADPTRAANSLRQAALKQHSAAQFAFATLCERGVGVPANSTQAFVFYSQALRGGQSAAQKRLDELCRRMSAQEIATAQKLIDAA
jgi:TPR repeat protein